MLGNSYKVDLLNFVSCQDVAEIMTSLSELVKTQGEEINTIEQNVEAARGKTSMGLLEIIKARRAKFAGVPVAGAVVGG